MKIIIAGGRDINPSADGLIEFLYLTYLIDNNSYFQLEIVSGCAAGVDTAAIGLAEFYDRPLHKFPADWDKHGKAAGPIRNKQMAEFADALLLIWDGESKGSANMKKNMLDLGKPVYEIIIKVPPAAKVLYGSTT